jgi:hypothetical protein
VADGSGNPSVGPAQAPGQLEYVLDTTSEPSHWDGSLVGPITGSVPTIGVDPRDDWMADPVCNSSTATLGGWRNTGDASENHRMDIRLSSLRLRRVHVPPQTYEDDVRRLYHRLKCEGADLATLIVLHDVIFVGGVTVDALMAPIQTRAMSDAYGGARRMW